MSREIKFRGKRSDTKAWVYGFYFEQPAVYGSYAKIYVADGDEETKDTGWVHVDRDTVGQLTANPFVNGVRVEEYEGDIVQFDTEDGVVTALVEHKVNSEGEDEWISGYVSRFVSIDERPDESLDGFRIAGNKWDNPELLNP